jgi:ribosomal protein L11 methyltransferase
MTKPTTIARLSCDEATARRVAAYLGESLDTTDVACAAFEGDDGRWHVMIHFRDAPDEARLRNLVGVAAGEPAADALNIESLSAADWVAKSLAELKPVRAGRLTIHGAHDRACLRSNEIGIEIEAALAFGTGHHGTTRGCLLALIDLTKRRHARRVLDIGTGTGVLAIAVARLLRATVVAADIDAVAVRSARANARLNRVASMVTFCRAAGHRAKTVTRFAPYQLIFANILLDPLTRLAVPLRKLAAPGARVVLSGLLPGHANAVLAIYRAQGLALERRIILEGWVTFVMRRGSGTKENRPGLSRSGFAGAAADISHPRTSRRHSS